MKPPTTVETTKLQFKLLSKLVRNLLIDNKNFQGDWDHRGYYFEHETLATYIHGPLKEQAEYIIERIDDLGDLMCDFMEDMEAELAGDEVPEHLDGKVSQLP